MLEKILVTGATGNTGLETIKCLMNKNLTVIAALRNPEKDKNLIPDNIQFVEFDFEKPETFKNAIIGVKKVYLVRPPALSDVKRYIKPFIDFLKNEKIEQLAFLSLIGAENNHFVPHYKIEQYIIESGIPYTFIRPSFFMQNLSTTHSQDIKENSEIFIPAGKGKTSFIDVRDIAEVSSLALSELGHKNKAYELTGSQALDYYQVAEIMSRVLDRKITYSDPSLFSFFQKMKARGYQTNFILVMIAIYTIARFGKAETVTDTIKILLKREPISIEKFLEDYKSCWF
ncbi:MAG: SDR family oxidoreductase [Candidatus Sericytochromatia bacterium]|nr:SDR family oxidoreductase [Candidatus Sericytochromatia bacterium]